MKKALFAFKCSEINPIYISQTTEDYDRLAEELNYMAGDMPFFFDVLVCEEDLGDLTLEKYYCERYDRWYKFKEGMLFEPINTDEPVEGDYPQDYGWNSEL